MPIKWVTEDALPKEKYLYPNWFPGCEVVEREGGIVAAIQLSEYHSLADYLKEIRNAGVADYELLSEKIEAIRSVTEALWQELSQRGLLVGRLHGRDGKAYTPYLLNKSFVNEREE